MEKFKSLILFKNLRFKIYLVFSRYDLGIIDYIIVISLVIYFCR